MSKIIPILFPWYASGVSEYEKHTNIHKSEFDSVELLKINCHHYVSYIFSFLQIHDSRLQQNNILTYIYLENRKFIPHNLLYIKRINYKLRL